MDEEAKRRADAVTRTLRAGASWHARLQLDRLLKRMGRVVGETIKTDKDKGVGK